MYGLTFGSMLTNIHTFWDAVKNTMPSNVRINVQGFGDIINDATGAITAAWTDSPPGEVVAGTTGAYSAPSGAIVRWTTGSVVDGHKVVGRTFIVPLAGNAYQEDGTLASGIITVIQNAASALVASEGANLQIWSRPRLARAATAKLPALSARAGSAHQVTGVAVPDRAAVLRSRRD